MTDPSHVVAAGDWHGNARWAVGVIAQLPDLLPAESPRRIVHVGDFGIWPGKAGDEFLLRVTAALDRVDAELWFVDGNHECHPTLDRLLARARSDRSRPIQVTSRIHWLPRGHRWTWHDRTWLALGGATSVDKPVRAEGKDWWPGEAIAIDDYYEATRPGPAEVMVCHDVPAGVPLNLPTPPWWWDLKPADLHRSLLRDAVVKVRPRWLFHGHYHLAHDTTVDLGYGPLQVTGLDMDGALTGNYRVLDVLTMEWVPVSGLVNPTAGETQ